MTKFVDEKNSLSRPTGEYAKVISQIAQQGVCPFCADHLTQFHKKPLEEHEYWWVTENMYPYTPTLHHCLFIHKKHITDISEITGAALTELMALIQEQNKKRSITGGSFILRFGDTKFTGASVSHLHAHIVQSNPDDPSYDSAKGLTMRIG